MPRDVTPDVHKVISVRLNADRRRGDAEFASVLAERDQLDAAFGPIPTEGERPDGARRGGYDGTNRREPFMSMSYDNLKACPRYYKSRGLLGEVKAAEWEFRWRHMNPDKCPGALSPPQTQGAQSNVVPFKAATTINSNASTTVQDNPALSTDKQAA